jgi:uncharacterized repeat protein (TIGR01451 family)
MARRLASLLLTVAISVTAVAQSADMSIQKTGPASPAVNPSQIIGYTVTMFNNGPSAAANVTMTDVLPPGTTLQNIDLSFAAGWNCAGTTTIVCSGPASFTAGGQVPIFINVLAPATPGPFINTATVSSNTPDPNPANNTANLTLTVVAPGSSADLSLQKSGPTLPVPVSSNIVYTLAITNNGPATEPAPVLTDVLPSGTTFVSATPVAGQVTCSGSTTIICNFGPLVPAGFAEVNLMVKAPSTPGSFTNNASVTGSLLDLNQANNSSSVTSSAVSTPFVNDVTVTKTGPSNPNVQPGSTVVYTLHVTNNGPDPASSVTITDFIPPTATYLGFSSFTNGVGCAGTTTVVCTFGQMISGPIDIDIQVRAPLLGGPFTNTATIAAGGGSDPNPANNTSAVTLNAVVPTPVPLSRSALLLLALLSAGAGIMILRR